MKKIVFTLSVFLLAAFSLSAENVLSPNPSTKRSSGNTINGFDGITPISFIIEGAANLNLYSSSVSWNTALIDSLHKTNAFAVPNSVVDDVYGSAIGFSPHFAFGVDVPINDKIGFAVRVGWDRKYVRNAVDGEFAKLDGTGNVLVENSWTKKVDYVNYSVDFRYNIIEQMSVNLGLVVDVLSRDRDITHWECSDVPLNQTSFYPQMASWANNSYYDEDMVREQPETNKTRVGLELGIDYKVPVLERFTIVPYARFQYFFTKLMKDRPYIPEDKNGEPVYQKSSSGDWIYSINDAALNTFQLGIALWFNFEKK